MKIQQKMTLEQQNQQNLARVGIYEAVTITLDEWGKGFSSKAKHVLPSLV